jgi:hypothetical protein
LELTVTVERDCQHQKDSNKGLLMRIWQINSRQAIFWQDRYQEKGQTMILFALMLVALVAFTGIAVDVGFGFVRSSQFSAAVDAAALAAVIDLDPQSESDTTAADARAHQFLAANGWNIGTTISFASGRAYTEEGIPQYTITVTWPVETFFMGIFGLRGYPVTHSATAAYFAQAEVYTPTAFERGQARKASQFLFGPESCTFAGDPVSSLHASAPGDPNKEHQVAKGIYRYRFSIPDDYEHDLVRVEIFDPDSVNSNVNASETIFHSNTYSNTNNSPTGSINCLGGSGQICVQPTQENLESVFENPLWFVRVDENWDGGCNPVPGNPNGNTTTTFELYYYSAQGQRLELAKYIETNSNPTATDMRWVAPGAPGPHTVTAQSGSFEVPIAPIPLGISNRRYIYLDVKATAGNAKNVFDVRAGKPHAELPSGWNNYNHINERNLYLANNPTFDPAGGVQTYALGRMPLQHYFDNVNLNIPLVPVDTVLAGGVIYATIFDYDYSVPPPEIEFTLDSIATSDFRMLAKVTDDPGSLPSYGIGSLCNEGLNCDNEWIWPQFRMGVPGNMYTAGTLYGKYVPRQNAHTWNINITSGRPVLRR